MDDCAPLEGMEAVVLAAGLGERLRPLSASRPKCLFPVMNRPLLEVCLEWLAGLGVVRARVNTHYLRGQVEAWLSGASLPLAVELSAEPEILGTGGGIRQAAAGLTSTFVVVNADCILRGPVDLAGALALHREHGALATLLLQESGSPPSITTSGGLITSLRGRPHDVNVMGAPGQAVGFTGLHIIQPELLRRIPEGFSDVIDVYLGCLEAGEPVCGHINRGHYFRDIGTPEGYLALHRDIFDGDIFDGRLQIGSKPEGGVLLGEGVVRGEGCRIGPRVVAGAGTVFGAGCAVRESVLWEGARIAPGAHVSGCVVGQGARVLRSARNEVIVGGAES
jgi:NDP-sugar pyrophosphorylase family protein